MRKETVIDDTPVVPLSKRIGRSFRHDRMDTAIEWLLIGLLTFMPLTFGAVKAWSELAVFLVVAAMSLCLALKHWIHGGFRAIGTWDYLSILLFLLLVVFQLLPLPNGLVARISPETASTKASLLDDMSKNPSLEKTTLSFYPHATKHDLRLALTAACVFIVVVQVFRHSRQIKRLLAAIAAIGLGFAVLALLQILSGTTDIYWTVPKPGFGVATAGSFVNHSHYAQFMNLSIGAALALLLVRLEETVDAYRRTRSLADVFESIRASSTGWLMAAIVLGGMTVFTSQSRNGIFSLVVAAIFTGILLAMKSKFRWRGWLLAMMLLAAFTGLLLVGFDVVYERLATIPKLDYNGRWEMTLCTLDAWRHYPVWGTGLGTHEIIFPMFDTAANAAVATHADNDYAQLLEETGLIGAILFAAFLIGIWWRYGRLVWKGKSPLAAAAFGLGFGLLTVMVHSATDFGQHLPANFCLSAIACGLLVAIARREFERPAAAATELIQAAPKRRRQYVFAVGMTGMVVGVWGCVLWEAEAARIGEHFWDETAAAETELRQNHWQGSDEEYVELISNAADAAETVPDNVKYRYKLNLYRWYSISRVVDSQTGRVLLDPQADSFVERIADELSQARILCPTYGVPYSVEGQLRLSFLHQPLGAELIRKGYRLAPYDAPTCFVAGILVARSGDYETAAAILHRAVVLDGSLYGEIMPIFLDEFDRPDMLRDLAGEDYGRLLALAKLLSTNRKHAALAEKVQADARAILEKRCESSDATANEFVTLAGICRTDHEYSASANYYRRALAINYSQVDWRMDLASVLAELGQREAAMHEARICLRLRPHMKSAENLIKSLSIRTK
jgi:O-antigen ligase/tetratricopeptide (TPR) repeat protein